jgi:Holliday junction DNA helicase RuvA
MISYLSGKILNISRNYIIIEVNNVGYQVFINPIMFSGLNVDQKIRLYTYQYVRDDALDLYGFKSPEELEMFKLWMSVSGIGPRSALGVLSISSMADLKDAITRGDPSLLTKVSGIGKKTAERVVLELREKVGETVKSKNQIAGRRGIIASSDEIDALMALGYSMSQAREALRQVDIKIKDSGDRIRDALKKLGK